MKVVVAFLFIFALEGALGYLFRKENHYSDFLQKHAQHDQSHVSGLNLEVTEEALNGLVDKLVATIGSEEEVEPALFQFPDDSSSDDFDEVDLTSVNEDANEVESGEMDPPVDAVVVSTKYGKWGCTFSRFYAIMANKTKVFWKVHESGKEGGKVQSNVKGTLDTGIYSQSAGDVCSEGNVTVYYKGKQYKNLITSTSSLNSTGSEKKTGKSGARLVSGSDASVSSNIKVTNKTFALTTTVHSKSETYSAPFNMYLTLFGSEFDVSAGGKHFGGTVKGEVVSRVVYSKNGKSLTKVLVKGFVFSEQANYTSMKMFRVKSHVWTKVVTAQSDNAEDSSGSASSEENGNGNVQVEVSTYGRGRVFGRTTGSNGKVFSGSGVASFEKDIVTFPSKNATPAHEYGVKWMINKLTDKHHIPYFYLGSAGLGPDMNFETA